MCLCEIAKKNPFEIYWFTFPTLLFWHAFKGFSKIFVPSSVEVLPNGALKPGFSHFHIEIHEQKIAEIISSRKNENKENNADACFFDMRKSERLWNGVVRLWRGKNV